MKKLIMSLAIVGMAVAAHAAKVSWGLTAGQTLANMGEGSTLYLFHGTVADTFGAWAESATSYDLASVTAATGGSLAKLDGVDNSLTLVDGTGSIKNILCESFDNGSTGSYSLYMVAISADGKNMAISSGKSLTIKAGTTPASATMATSAFTAYSAVPEPTSGLLFLLGIAGMALRRRRS